MEPLTVTMNGFSGYKKEGGVVVASACSGQLSMAGRTERLHHNLDLTRREIRDFREAHCRDAVRKFSEMVAEEKQKFKARPPKAKPRQKTEAELILAAQPQTSSRMIGHHAVTHVQKSALQRPAQQPLSEFKALQRTLPQTSSQQVGFHLAFAKERDELLAGAQRISKTVGAKQVATDPELRAGMQALRSRIIALRMRANR